MSSQKHLNKREQIVNSTITVMQEIGYEETSVRAICEAANISIGTFYHYFKDKTELLNLILGKIDIYLENEIRPLLTSPSASVNLKTFALGFAKETSLSSYIYGGVLSSPKIPLPHEKAEITEEKHRTLYTIPKEIIENGQATGEFSTLYPADDLVDKLITCLRGCAMDWARRHYNYNIEEYILSFMDIFCNAITNMKPNDN